MLSSADSPQTIKTDHTQSAFVALHDQILQSVPKTMKRKDGNGCKILTIRATVKNPIAYFTRQKVLKKC